MLYVYEEQVSHCSHVPSFQSSLPCDHCCGSMTCIHACSSGLTLVVSSFPLNVANCIYPTLFCRCASVTHFDNRGKVSRSRFHSSLSRFWVSQEIIVLMLGCGLYTAHSLLYMHLLRCHFKRRWPMLCRSLV